MKQHEPCSHAVAVFTNASGSLHVYQRPTGGCSASHCESSFSIKALPFELSLDFLNIE
jgi:hypothetical protein